MFKVDEPIEMFSFRPKRWPSPTLGDAPRCSRWRTPKIFVVGRSAGMRCWRSGRDVGDWRTRGDVRVLAGVMAKFEVEQGAAMFGLELGCTRTLGTSCSGGQMDFQLIGS